MTSPTQHLGTKTLSTNRLTLRRFRLEDAEAMWRNWALDPDVTRFLTWQPHTSVDETRSIIKGWIKGYQQPDNYQWAITLKKQPDEPIGSISVVEKDDRIRMVHIGYCIGKNWWHQGITSEALEEIIRCFFEEVGINRIESRHDPANPYSGKVMIKCGLKLEGVKKQGDWNNQGICDCLCYGLVREDYRKTQ